ncbi:MAG TPA: DNA-processing protein DprA [Stenotrophomonas sp.]|nr:DNA-processing protein DprA [Stenotrophomonas sp.]
MADLVPSPPAAAHRAWLTLLLAGGPAAPRRALLDAHGDARAALAAGAVAWRAAGCTPAQLEALTVPAQANIEHALRWLDRAGHHLIGYTDARYPLLLRETDSAPLALFVDGEPALLQHPGVAIVGSRRPSASGTDHTTEFAHALAAAGLVVVSGLAAGIDAAAHRAALTLPQGLTVAVLGTGADVPYPSRHAGLRDLVAARGAVVSEYLPGTRPLAGHFPARNRIVAGLTLGTLVIEAAQRSGALITARLAAEAGREVFAVPGSIRNPLARGCHRLIRDGALLVESPQEVLAVLGPLALRQGRNLQPVPASALHGDRPAPIEQAGAGFGPGCGFPSGPGQPPSPASADYQRLWRALGHDPIPMDSLVQRTGLTAATLSSMLLAMELEGRVVAEHGRYTRNP